MYYWMVIMVKTMYIASQWYQAFQNGMKSSMWHVLNHIQKIDLMQVRFVKHYNQSTRVLNILFHWDPRSLNTLLLDVLKWPIIYAPMPRSRVSFLHLPLGSIPFPICLLYHTFSIFHSLIFVSRQFGLLLH